MVGVAADDIAVAVGTAVDDAVVGIGSAPRTRNELGGDATTYWCVGRLELPQGGFRRMEIRYDYCGYLYYWRLSRFPMGCEDGSPSAEKSVWCGDAIRRTETHY